MVILVGTSALLWTLSEPDRLSPAARDAVEHGEATLSVASYWEVVIKSTKGLLHIAEPVSWWNRTLALFGGRILPIRANHVTALAALPDLHRDPFDRILIAQTIAEGGKIITGDRMIKEYPVQVIW